MPESLSKSNPVVAAARPPATSFSFPVSPSVGEVALEVIVRFGHSVLKVAHVALERGFCLGEPRFRGDHVDFPTSAELLGRTWLPLLVNDDSGAPCAVIPRSATGWLIQERRRTELADLLPRTSSTQLVADADLLRLAVDARLHLRLPGLDIELALVEPVAPTPRSFADVWEDGVPVYFGASAAVFLTCLGALSFFAPPLGLQDETELDRARLLLISQYLDASSEREQRTPPTESPHSGNDGGTPGKRAPSSEGESGKIDELRRPKQAAVHGPKDNPELTLSRHELLAEARQSGMIGLLQATDMGSNFAHPIFGRDQSLGNADLTAQGAMWGDELGESGGRGGLGLSGPGFGGGNLLGDGVGIGVGPLGTIGLGDGKMGTGLSHGRPGGHHVGKAPVMRTVGETAVSGRLPAQVIQRVVRQNFGRFRMCYEQGLGRNPGLEGRVSVRFVIGRDGAVSTVSAGGDLPDQGTKSCMVSAFYGIGFPPPEEGVVQVTYPLMFSPQ